MVVVSFFFFCVKKILMLLVEFHRLDFVLFLATIHLFFTFKNRIFPEGFENGIELL